MKHVTLLFSFVFYIALPLASNGEVSQISPHNGEAVYKVHCLKCHGLYGKGDGPEAEELIVPPSNFHRFESRIKSEENLRAAIIWGLAFSPMHGWWGKFSGTEIRSVSAYIRKLAPYQPWRP